MKQFEKWLETTNFIPPISDFEDGWIEGAEAGWKEALKEVKYKEFGMVIGVILMILWLTMLLVGIFL